MNRYFSHDEKVKLTRIMLLGGLLKETIKEYAGLQNTDKEFLKNLRTANTWLKKGLKRRYDLADIDAARDFSRNAANLQMICEPTDVARRKIAAMKEEQGTIVMTLDDFYIWYSSVIPDTCGKCQKKKYRQCPQRQFLMKFNCEPVNPKAEGCCQYSYPAAGIPYVPIKWEKETEE